MEKVLPKGWVETTLGEIAEWGSGGTPNRAIADYYNGTIPWVKTGDLNDGLITHSNEFITELGLQKSSAKIFPKGSVVLAMYGATIGKTGILDFDSSTNQACAVAKTFFNMNKFLFLFLKSEKETFIEKGKGGAQPNISQTVIKTHKIALPPLAEQERIVAKLDKHFAKVDKIKLRISNLNKLKIKFFESLFYSKATITILGQFLVERKSKVGESYNNFKKIGVSAKEGIIDLSTGTKENFENYKIVEKGDFIYNTMRINIGSIAIYEGIEPAITSPDYVVFSAKNISKYLLLAYLKSESGIKNISSVTTGSVRSRLYFKNLATIPFPDLDQDKHILAEKILSWFDINLSKLGKFQEIYFEPIKNSLLYKAFKGELVPQLPTDGDAKDFLAKIMTLKNEVKGKKK
ncbi:restriction endonuclease subunit S [Pedobacter antarcticus]|uniref:restriction endonuclease subunit S n=1 Tax=Pedobacter antarcticus TaxID=34086 RepID=UPI000885B6A1|nr:restriction endonuclease subunit S [Pedobacter antarcticus]SDL84539.1 Restriction endonuclease S subunit [Pedobacter antarcticus]